MLQLGDIVENLVRRGDGIWYATESEPVSYPAEGNAACLAIEESSFWFNHRNACIVAAVQAHPPEPNALFIDIGGGNGYVSLALNRAGLRVVLVEPGGEGASAAKSRGLPDVICASFRSASFRDGSIGAAGLFDVLEHMQDDSAFLAELRAKMARRGRLYVTVPAYEFLWSGEDAMTGHFRRYTVKRLTRLLRSSGFDVIYSTYFFRFLPLPIFLLRSLPHRLGIASQEVPVEKTQRDHTAPAYARRAMNRLLAPELRLIRAGKRMQFGGSCLVAAEVS